ncbi:MAG: hypothetical protein OXG37_01155 [Actinomycetia bacterium]|nr:hypothetical protein [Actinomycetes bacterium]
MPRFVGEEPSGAGHSGSPLQSSGGPVVEFVKFVLLDSIRGFHLFRDSLPVVTTSLARALLGMQLALVAAGVPATLGAQIAARARRAVRAGVGPVLAFRLPVFSVAGGAVKRPLAAQAVKDQDRVSAGYTHGSPLFSAQMTG